MRSEMSDGKVDRAKMAAGLLSRYIQFDTTNPPGSEAEAAHWLADQIRVLGVTTDITVFKPAPMRAILLARIGGSEDLAPLVLNHHIDVVPADAAAWSHLPFDGDIAGGYVWGRGALDTKSLGIVHLLALAELQREGVAFRRPVVLLAVSDEETGGSQGMGWLVENRLGELAPGIVWDEGGLGLKGVFGDGVFFGVAVAEKQIQHLRVVARGRAGHGSMPHDDNANVHLMQALERVLAPRPVRVNEVTRAMFAEIAATQTFPRSFLLRHLGNRLILALMASALTSDKLTNAMVRDTISLTMLESGYKVNVIPDRAEAAIDCRLLPDTDVAAFRRDLETAAGDDAIVEEIETSPPTAMSPVDGAFVRAVRGAVAEHLDQALVAPLQMPGGSDARFFRQRGIPAYGFAPFVLTRDELDRVHGVDERISIENLRLGVAVAKGIIRRLCVEDDGA